MITQTEHAKRSNHIISKFKFACPFQGMNSDGIDFVTNHKLNISYDHHNDNFILVKYDASYQQNDTYGFDIVFDSYQYPRDISQYPRDISQYPRDISQYPRDINIPIGSYYKIIFWIKLGLLYNSAKSKDFSEWTNDSVQLHIISKCLLKSQIREIVTKKSFLTNNLKKFINVRENNHIVFDKWNFYRLDSDTGFCFHKKKFIRNTISNMNINTHKFKKKGGIIETNNLEALIKRFFPFNSDDLVILPERLKRICDAQYQLSYQELKEITLDQLLFHNMAPSRIIILECKREFLNMVKYISNIFSPQIIWMINSLPLKYYLHNDKLKPPDKISLNDILSISNLWMGYGNIEKKRYRKELLRLFLTDFNKYYTKYYYHDSYLEKIPIYPYLNDTDIYIKNIITDLYKTNINRSLDLLNLYSYLCQKIVSNEEVLKNKIKKKIDRNISKFTEEKNIIENLRDIVNSVGSISGESLVHSENLQNSMESIILAGVGISIYEEKIRIYSDMNPQQKIYNVDHCPICYDTDFQVIAIPLCGHGMCLVCSLEFFSKDLTECSICRANSLIKDIYLLDKKGFGSGIISFLQKREFFMTDIDKLKYISHKTYITNPLLIDNTHKINMLNSSNINSRSINQIINYFKLHFPEIKICSYDFIL
jgi:hypothetical protein